MKTKNRACIIAGPLFVLMLAPLGQAADSSTPTTCKDGTTSTATGRGACSGHGGVKKAAAAAPAAGAAASTAPAAVAAPAPVKAPPAAAPAAAKSTASATAGNTDPTGATAKCKDGTYSKSQHRSGACSGHGGVATWLTATP